MAAPGLAQGRWIAPEQRPQLRAHLAYRRDRAGSPQLRALFDQELAACDAGAEVFVADWLANWLELTPEQYARASRAQMTRIRERLAKGDPPESLGLVEVDADTGPGGGWPPLGRRPDEAHRGNPGATHPRPATGS